MTPRAPRRDSDAALLAGLTARQRDIVELLAKGLSNDQIGLALSISPATVRTHVTAILSALQVDNRTEAAALYVSHRAGPQQVAQVLERPAIAVLPLRPLDDEPRTITAAAGLTCDLSDLFARWCWFPVVSAGLRAADRPASETPREAGQRLGVCFLVDGALRTRGDRFRLTVRVDDCRDGANLWTGRFEGAAAALLGEEDDICESIVAVAYPLLVARAERHLRGLGQPKPATPCAWELAHEGMALQAQREARSNAECQRRFGEALGQQPDLVLAHYGLGLASYDEILNQWGEAEPALARLARCADRCVDLAPHAAEGYYLLGRHHQSRGDHALAAHALEAAIGRNPSFGAAHALLAQTLVLTGRFDEGLARMKQAARLGPRAYVTGLAVVYFVRGEYAEALCAAELALSVRRNYPFALVIAAASAFWLGQLVAAAAHLRTLREVAPTFAPSAFRIFGAQVDGVDRIVRALEAIEGRRPALTG